MQFCLSIYIFLWASDVEGLTLLTAPCAATSGFFPLCLNLIYTNEIYVSSYSTWKWSKQSSNVNEWVKKLEESLMTRFTKTKSFRWLENFQEDSLFQIMSVLYK